MTGITELDTELQNKVKQITVAYYPEYFIQEPDITIAVVSPIPKLDIAFEDFLYELKKRNMRVIVLLDNEHSKYMKYALSLGITDIIFDPIDTDKVISKLKYNTPFSDIAKYYDKNNVYSVKTHLRDNSDEKMLKLQIVNLFKYFDKKIDAELSINELMALLENEVIKKEI